MNLTKKIRVNGWLPAGLILNSRLMTESAELNPLTPATVRPGLMQAQGRPETMINIWSLSQADETTMLRAVGKFMSPVVFALLNEEPIENASPQFLVGDDYDRSPASPYSHPCVLLASAQFEGDIEYYTGSDTPQSYIGFGSSWETRDLSDYKTFQYLLRPGQFRWAYEIILPACVYVPKICATSGIYGVDELNMSYWVRRLNMQMAETTGDTAPEVYGSAWIAPFTEFRLPSVAMAGLKQGYKTRWGNTKAFSAVELIPRFPLAENLRVYLTPSFKTSQFVGISQRDSDVRSLEIVEGAEVEGEINEAYQAIELIFAPESEKYYRRFLIAGVAGLESSLTL